jgi:hypothetical protein
MAATGAGFLRALVVGYWVVSVTSVEAGCLEGWGHPRLTALAATGSLAVGAVVAGILATTGGGLWAVAGGVAAWMTATGLATAAAWQRVSRFPASRLGRELLRPIGEMAVLGGVLGVLAEGWIAPGPGGLLACGALAALLFAYGFLRIFQGSERRLLLGRIAGLARA